MKTYFVKTYSNKSYFDFCLLPNIRIERAIDSDAKRYYNISLEWPCFAFMVTTTNTDDYETTKQ